MKMENEELKTWQRDEFNFNGKQYKYCDATYNHSRLNERAVEVPIGLEFLARYPNLLEIGAVLPHYVSNWSHAVVDKGEVLDGVINEDILTFDTDKRFDAALSISTLEHLGNWENLLRAMDNIKRLLKPRAPYLFTVPYGYRTFVDNYVLALNPRRLDKTNSLSNIWQQVTHKRQPKAYTRWANTVYIVEGIA